MTISKQAIEEVRQLAHKRRKLADEAETVLRSMERMAAEEAHSPSDTANIVSGQNDLNGVDYPLVAKPKASKSTLDQIRESLDDFADREFSVSDIEHALTERGRSFPRKSARPRIAMLLRKLEKKGTIERTFRATGPIPHRFRVRPPENDGRLGN